MFLLRLLSKTIIIYTPLREGINEICYINGTFHPFYHEKKNIWLTPLKETAINLIDDFISRLPNHLHSESFVTILNTYYLLIVEDKYSYQGYNGKEKQTIFSCFLFLFLKKSEQFEGFFDVTKKLKLKSPYT